jgi:uncharacterized membrane protein
MPVRLTQFLDQLRASYWFIPTVMSVLAVALAFGTSIADRALGSDWIEALDWLEANRPSGAREVLSAIASSMITVAGVVFSITVVAVVYASGQHGPRLLTNFMRDRGNQITLGTFIATYLYCLLILRTVRDAEEVIDPENAADAASGFVPHIGMFVALGLALCSIAVLVYFIHHIPRSINISNVIAEIGRELRGMIEKRFPDRIGHGVPEELDPALAEPADFAERACTVDADGVGYVQAVDVDALLDVAKKRDLVLRVHHRPGTFVRPGKALVEVYPKERADEEVRDRIRVAFAWGAQRTPVQDFLFLVNELVEIASRALSPGVNDPMTAVTCLDWLAAGAAQFAGRDSPDALRYDEDRNLRVITHPVGFGEFAEAAFGQLRPYAAGDRIAGMKMMAVLGELAEAVFEEESRAVLRYHANALMEGAEKLLADPESLVLMRIRHREVMALLRGRAEDTARNAGWTTSNA